LRGQALVEAGLIMTILVPVTFTVLDFAGILFAYLAMQNGVTQATRFAVTGNTSTDSSGTSLSRDQSIRQAMRSNTPGFVFSDSNFSFYNLTKDTSGSGGPNDLIRVSVTYDWLLLTPFLRPFFPSGSVHIAVASTMRNEPYPTS
jgi:Flp pilus assembly protein TadG